MEKVNFGVCIYSFSNRWGGDLGGACYLVNNC